MVFESLIADLMNKYLGDFVENLDKSQLKLSIWGGDIVLNNLDLKESALDELDLPIRVKSGHLGKLTLKIPWKNLYSSPVVATIDGLYLLAVPNVDSQYNADKDAKKKREAKEKELDKVEKAKQRAREKSKPKAEKSDSFAEKMAFQIIKNLQVQISNIHVRYEDKYTSPDLPFAIGLTLHDLSFQTCDKDWKKCLVDTSSNLIFKLVELDCLAAYWNTNSRLYSDIPREQLRNVLKGGIAGTEPKLPPYQYMMKPMSMKAKVQINPKPSSDLSIPKVYLNLVLEEIGVSLAKRQFQDVMQLLESFERMARNEPYRKYRPGVPAKGHAKQWWHYAQNCILKENVRRKTNMWSWSNISKHRELGKKYKAAWKEKLLTKKPPQHLLDTIKAYEEELNVFSIVLSRQHAEAEVAKSGSKVKKSKSKEDGKSGWLGGWFGGGKKKKQEEQGTKPEEDIAGQFAKELTAEKSKMYDAIGYSEGSADPTFPFEYVGMKFHFKLKKTSLQLRDESLWKTEVVSVDLEDLYASVQQRPSADAVKLEAKIDSFSISGSEHKNGRIPHVVKSQKSDSGHVMSLLDLQVETNPLDGKADQRISVKARPLEIIYDAHTINQVANFFKPPEDVHLKQLQAAAMSKLNAIKSQSATGLTYMISTRKVTDISVDLKSSYIIIPKNGVYEHDTPLLVVNLGDFKMKSLHQEKMAEWRKQQNLPIEELLQKAYDKFNIQLDSMQVLLERPGQDWKSARTEPQSSLHIIEPTGINVQLQKCMIPNDVRMPMIKISGELPRLCVNVSDKKVHELISIASSIPLPESDSPKTTAKPLIPDSPEELTAGYDVVAPRHLTIPGDTNIIIEDTDSDSESTVSDEFYTPSQSTEELVHKYGKPEDLPEQLTNLELNFEVKEVALNVSQWKNGKEAPLLRVAIQNVGTAVKQRTYDLNVNAFLGCVLVEHKHFKAQDNPGPLYLINTPMTYHKTDHLLLVNYLKVDKKSPEFYSSYEKTEQSIDVTFRSLDVIAHLEAILDVLSFVDTIVPKPEQKTDVDEGYISDEEKKKNRHGRSTRPEPRIEIDMKLTAALDKVSLLVCSQQSVVTNVKVNGIQASVIVQKHKTTIDASLKDVVVLDPSPGAVHPKIVSIKDTEVLNLHMVAHNGATLGPFYSDMDAVDTEIKLHLGRIGVVFVNKFVMDVLEFVNHFQAAKDAVTDASKSAASSAKATVQDLHERSARLLLDITIQAPLVIIPESSKSVNVMVADLGILTVKNAFSIPDKTVDKDSPPIVDAMNVKLTSVKLSRALMDNDKIISETLILQPVDIIVDITRNLAASWYHKIPNVEITGKLPALKVSLGQDDFAMVMATLDGNLNEGAKPKEKPLEDTVTGETTKAAVEEKKDKKKDKKSLGLIKPGSVWINLKFCFEVDSISAELYTGSTDLKTGHGIVARDPANGLGKCVLEMIKVNGTIYTDNSIGAMVSLGNLLLDDIRPGREKGIYRMFDRYTSPQETGSDKVNMIVLDFKQLSNQEKDINMKVKKMFICVCLEYLLTVADFFTNGLPKKETPVSDEEDKTKKVEKKSDVSKEEGTKEQPAATRIVLSVEDPEIVLVADSSDVNTNALVLKTSVDFKMDLTPECMSMGGSVNKLQIIHCPFKKEKRAQLSSKVLQPCSISFHLSQPQEHGQHIDIAVTEIAFNTSPRTIQTISAIAATMKPPQQEEEIEKKKSKEAVTENIWGIKRLQNCNFWFLKEAKPPEEADPSEAVALIDEIAPSQVIRGDQLIMKVEKIKLTIEAVGAGQQTVPMLMMEANVTAEVKDWTSNLYVTSDISMELSYYNVNMAEWEPIVEPVEVSGGHRPWELNIEVQKNIDNGNGADDDDGSSIDLTDIPPVMSIAISSSDVMELTMTKSCIKLLTNLGKAFQDAMNQPEAFSLSKLGEEHPPFMIKNHLGAKVVIAPGSVFQESKDKNGKITLNAGGSQALYPIAAVKSLLGKKSFLRKDISEMRREIAIQVEGFKEVFNIPINRASKRFYNLEQLKGYPHTVYSVVVDVVAELGGKTIHLRSPLQIENNMPYVMELYAVGSGNQLESIGQIEENGKGQVPLKAAYGQDLYAKPVLPGYKVCDAAISADSLWQLKQSGKQNTVFRCAYEKQGNAPYYFTVHADQEDYDHIIGRLDKAPRYLLHMLPTVQVKNLLPVKVICAIQDAAEELVLEGGQSKQLFNADMGKILEMRLPNYLDKEWTSRMTLRNGMKELSGWKFTAYEGKQEITMELGVFVSYNKGFKDMAVYAPYWMINKTGLPIAYKGTDDKNVTSHPADYQDPIMFTFGKQLLGKKKASLQIQDSDWSDKFSLDTVGSSGCITCKSKDITYEVGVKIHLTNAALTKIVTLTPMYLVVNHSDITLSVAEEATDKWYDVTPGECLPFWPKTKIRKEMRMQVKAQNSAKVTAPFNYNKAGSILLKVPDPKIGGIAVLLNVSEWSNIISLNSYYNGAATVQLINHCTSIALTYNQVNSKSDHVLSAKEAVLYTWEDPCGKLELQWKMFETSNKNKLLSDGFGVFDISDKKKCYWVSFLDGMQRTLMFTEDLAMAVIAQQAGELEQADMDLNLSLQGFGLSLVNNQSRSEIVYMGITSSGIVWEFAKRRRWKPLKMKQSDALEAEFQKIQSLTSLGKPVAEGTQRLDGDLEVDILEMKMLKPKKCKIRRTYNPGIWAKYKASEHQLQLHAKINRLQVDNQLPASVFPTVLAPVPPPKSVSAESEPKPFTELSIMTRYGQHTNVKQVKYFKLLIQEMHAKIDQGFLNAILLMFETEPPTELQELELYKEDITRIQKELKDSEEVQSAMGEERNFYDNLHLSPIKIHLSFSLHDSGDDPGATSPQRGTGNAPVHLLLQSVGVTLTNVQDVIFKLAYFERQHNFYTSKELTREGIKHYSSQAIKQAYVLVLGLDVLGNPFGFVRGLTEGVTDLFYEPYQGAVQGPEEFAEGLALGVRSLFGHAVGGAAGVVSRVTGTLGKGLAALTMDDEYQKKRLKAMNERPADLKEGLARGGKGLVMGFVEGVSGIVTQPVKGAKKEGAAGFFKGVGKGLVGVVAKPTGGVIDMASSAFDGIRRAAEVGEEVQRLRPPRLIHADGIVRPYIRKEAEGYGIFIETEKGKYIESDKYYAHAVVTKDAKNVLLVTNKRVVFVSKGDILGHWNCEWQYTYQMLREPPHLSDRGITFLIKEEGKKKKGFAGLFGGGSSSGKLVPMSDSKTAQWIVGKMHEAMSKATQ